MGMIKTLIERYKKWKEYRFLKKHGCENWKQYNKQYDPDVIYRASRVSDFYQGYEYVYCCERDDHPVYHYGLGFSVGIEQIAEWAETNIKDNWRYDGFRVIHRQGNWEFNDIGGGDFYFFAFKDKKDYTMFLLKWS